MVKLGNEMRVKREDTLHGAGILNGTIPRDGLERNELPIVPMATETAIIANNNATQKLKNLLQSAPDANVIDFLNGIDPSTKKDTSSNNKEHTGETSVDFLENIKKDRKFLRYNITGKGGKFNAFGMEVAIPECAVTGNFPMVICESNSAIDRQNYPQGFQLQSPIYHCMPHGCRFHQPIIMSIPLKTNGNTKSNNADHHDFVLLYSSTDIDEPPKWTVIRENSPINDELPIILSIVNNRCVIMMSSFCQLFCGTMPKLENYVTVAAFAKAHQSQGETLLTVSLVFTNHCEYDFLRALKKDCYGRYLNHVVYKLKDKDCDIKAEMEMSGSWALVQFQNKQQRIISKELFERNRAKVSYSYTNNSPASNIFSIQVTVWQCGEETETFTFSGTVKSCLESYKTISDCSMSELNYSQQFQQTLMDHKSSNNNMPRNECPNNNSYSNVGTGASFGISRLETDIPNSSIKPSDSDLGNDNNQTSRKPIHIRSQTSEESIETGPSTSKHNTINPSINGYVQQSGGALKTPHITPQHQRCNSPCVQDNFASHGLIHQSISSAGHPYNNSVVQLGAVHLSGAVQQQCSKQQPNGMCLTCTHEPLNQTLRYIEQHKYLYTLAPQNDFILQLKAEPPRENTLPHSVITAIAIQMDVEHPTGYDWRKLAEGLKLHQIRYIEQLSKQKDLSPTKIVLWYWDVTYDGDIQKLYEAFEFADRGPVADKYLPEITRL